MGFRRLTAGAVVLMVLPLVAGCSLLDGGRVLELLGQDGAVREELSAIADALESLPGVESVGQSYDYGEGAEYQLDLIVDVTGSADLVPIAEAVRVGYSRGELASLTQRLLISAPTGGLVTQTDFSMTAHDLARDLDYRASVSLAIDAQLSMRLAGALFGDEQYSRVIGSPEPETTEALIEHYADVVRIADSSVSSHSWDLPGLWTSGSLPPLPYLTLLGELAHIVPLHPYNGAGVASATDGIALWGGDVAGWQTAHGFQLLLGEDQPATVVAVARAISDSGVVPVSLQYPHGDSFGAVHFGDCAYGPQEGQYAESFVVELAGAGVPVTVTDNLGLCAGPEL